MPERYTLHDTGALRDRFELAAGVPAGVKPSYNLSPTQLVPAIVTHDGANELRRMKWGFIPETAKDTNSVFRYKTYVAKSEGIFSKPTWQHAIRSTRCLIPANGYYEWHKTADGKRPFYTTVHDQALYAFAGIYSSWTDPEGRTWQTCAIVTIATLEGIRQPVILHPDDEATWLDATKSDMTTLYGIMRAYPQDMLHEHEVTPDVKNVKRSDASLIKPVA